MNSAAVEASLKDAYIKWRATFNRVGIDIDKLTPPLLVSPCVPSDSPYCDAVIRVLVVGQETLGWGWDSQLQQCYPNYPYPWRFSSQNSFRDFLENSDSVEALMWGYGQFAFSKYQPRNWRGPFWTTFRLMEAWKPRTGFMQTNLCKAAYENGKFLNCPEPGQGRMIEEQAEIFRREVQILEPHVTIFLTGPNYDSVLERIYPGILIDALNTTPAYRLAQLHHPGLPGLAYRTYHPNYLRFSGNAHFLEDIRQAASL